MTLLKDDGTAPGKTTLHKVNIIAWPVERMPEGIGLSVKDGWNIGIGFWLATIIAVPIISLSFSCIVAIGLSILGSSLGALF